MAGEVEREDRAGPGREARPASAAGERSPRPWRRSSGRPAPVAQPVERELDLASGAGASSRRQELEHEVRDLARALDVDEVAGLREASRSARRAGGRAAGSPGVVSQPIGSLTDASSPSSGTESPGSRASVHSGRQGRSRPAQRRVDLPAPAVRVLPRADATRGRAATRARGAGSCGRGGSRAPRACRACARGRRRGGGGRASPRPRRRAAACARGPRCPAPAAATGRPSIEASFVTRWGHASARWVSTAPPFEWPTKGTGPRVVESSTASASRASASQL